MITKTKKENVEMNGSYIIIAKKNNTTISSVVLGYTPAIPEWVTWITDDKSNCYNGHYFSSIHDAVADYEKRT